MVDELKLIVAEEINDRQEPLPVDLWFLEVGWKLTLEVIEKLFGWREAINVFFSVDAWCYEPNQD